MSNICIEQGTNILKKNNLFFSYFFTPLPNTRETIFSTLMKIF